MSQIWWSGIGVMLVMGHHHQFLLLLLISCGIKIGRTHNERIVCNGTSSIWHT